MPLLLSEICRLILGFLEEENLMKSYQVLLEESPFLAECRVYQTKGITFDTKIHGKSLIDYLWSIRFPDEFESKKTQTDKSSRENQADKYVQTDGQVTVVANDEQVVLRPVVVDQPTILDSADTTEPRGSRKRKAKLTRYTSNLMSPIKQIQLISSSPNGSDNEDESDINVNKFIESLCTNDFAVKLAQSINDFKTKKNFNLSASVGLDSINNSSMLALLNPSQSSEDSKKPTPLVDVDPSSSVFTESHANVQPSVSCASIGGNIDLFGSNSSTSLTDTLMLAHNHMQTTEIDPIDANLGIDDISQLADMFAEEAFDLLTSDLINNSDPDCTLTAIKGQGASILQFEAGGGGHGQDAAQAAANSAFESFESRMMQAIAESSLLTNHNNSLAISQPPLIIDSSIQQQKVRADDDEDDGETTIRVSANNSIELIEDAETLKARRRSELEVEKNRRLLSSGQPIISLGPSGSCSSITIQKCKRSNDEKKEIEPATLSGEPNKPGIDDEMENHSSSRSKEEEEAIETCDDQPMMSDKESTDNQRHHHQLSVENQHNMSPCVEQQNKQSSDFLTNNSIENINGDDEDIYANLISSPDDTTDVATIDQIDNKTPPPLVSSISPTTNSQTLTVAAVDQSTSHSSESREVTTIRPNIDLKSISEPNESTTIQADKIIKHPSSCSSSSSNDVVSKNISATKKSESGNLRQPTTTTATMAKTAGSISNESRLAQAARLPDIFGYALQVQLSVKSRLREGGRKTMPDKPPHLETRRNDMKKKT